MWIDLDGLKFGFDDQGYGLPVLFIHGFPLTRKLWSEQVGTLSRNHRVLALDLRGHGETQAVPGPYSMELLARDCCALLDALQIQVPVVLCGLSMGGYIALAFYRLFAPRVAGLVLAATRAGADTAEGKQNRTRAIEVARINGAAEIAESMLPKMFAPNTYQKSPHLVSQLRSMMAGTSTAGVLGALEGMRDRPDSEPMLASIHVPTLIIHGAEDQLIPPGSAQDMHAAIPSSRLVILPEAGHIVNWEQPELFNQAIFDFISHMA